MAVHPRVCGERVIPRGLPATVPGSSPRVRGTAGTAFRRRPRRRFIPACAGNGPSIRPAVLAGSVHPRVCGEREKALGLKTSVTGSSPRVRGTAGGQVPGARAGRFIPACAGNGTEDSPGSMILAVHPRVCGERSRSARPAARTTGSSPRVRGTGFPGIDSSMINRFIPACAGNGSVCTVGTAVRAVHPRVCGERAQSVTLVISIAGSSPRVRGTGSVRRRCCCTGRFIPACAGNGLRGAHPGGPAAVHPRVCGERICHSWIHLRGRGSSPRVRGTGIFTMRRLTGTGSSPRVRGTGGPTDGDDIRIRFIPACAGNGGKNRPAHSSRAVHPRVCGERPAVPELRFAANGSSPRVRGTGLGRDRGLLAIRFIPACAGNGEDHLHDGCGRSVHPRVCGERLAGKRHLTGSPGSSPRVRGTVHQADHDPGAIRFIPACAGNGALRQLLCWQTAVHPRVCGERVV